MKDLQHRLLREPEDKWIWIIQELFHELFARLGTGIIFLISSAWAIQPLKVFFNGGHTPWLADIFNVNSPYFSIYVAFAIFFAYLIGLIFGRLEIKSADRLSFQRRAKCLYWDLLKAQAMGVSKIRRLLMYPKWILLVTWHYMLMKVFDEYPKGKFKGKDFEYYLIREFACCNKAKCEFPYPHLHKYLEIRGLSELAKLVNWDDTSGKNELRTRNYIDLLKLRIRFYGGHRVMHIVRNQAHVRLLSSMWWAARIETWISLIVIISVSAAEFASNPPLSSLYPAIAIFIIAGFLRISITNYLHDLRMRELIQILGTDCILSKIYGDEYARCC